MPSHIKHNNSLRVSVMWYFGVGASQRILITSIAVCYTKYSNKCMNAFRGTVVGLLVC